MQEETSKSDNEMADSTTKSVFLDGTSSTSEVWGVCDDLWIELNYPSLGYKDKNILLQDKKTKCYCYKDTFFFFFKEDIYE